MPEERDAPPSDVAEADADASGDEKEKDDKDARDGKPRKVEKNYMTPDGYRRLADELEFLRHKKRPEVVSALADAAAEGDRSENAEYIYRKRQLREIDRLTGKIREKGYTLVPLSLYEKDGRVKVELALVHGKQEYDRRQDVKKREAQREIDRGMASRRR